MFLTSFRYVTLAKKGTSIWYFPFLTPVNVTFLAPWIMKWFSWHILITEFWRWTIIRCCLHYRWTSLVPTNPWCLRWRWNLEEIFLLEEFDGTYRSNFRSIHGKFHFALFSCFISSKNIHVDVFHKKYTSEKKNGISYSYVSSQNNNLLSQS